VSKASIVGLVAMLTAALYNHANAAACLLTPPKRSSGERVSRRDSRCLPRRAQEISADAEISALS